MAAGALATALASAASGTSVPTTTGTDGRIDARRTLRRPGSMAKETGLPNLAGILSDKAAPATQYAQAAPDGGATSNRNVEALFRIRMKATERTQQERIERALEKRNRAEHKARTTTVIADAFKRELASKDQALEELMVECADLKEYKTWAQKKHVHDARLFKEKVESFVELQVALQVETDKRLAQQRANADLESKLESMVAARTASYNETIAEMEQELLKRAKRIEEAEQARLALVEQLKAAGEAHAALEARCVAEAAAQTAAHNSHVAQLQEMSILNMRQLHAAQDESVQLRRVLASFEEKHHALTMAQDHSLESLAHKELLIARLHRHMAQTADKHVALSADAAATKCVLKYLLASCLVKGVRRRKMFRAIFVQQMDLCRKLGMEVLKQTKAAALAQQAQQQAGVGGSGMGQGASAASYLTAVEDDGSMESSATSLASSFATLSARSGRVFASTSKLDPLLSRVGDLLPQMRSLVDELSSRKEGAQNMAEAFFKRTIELKQQLIDLEKQSGIKIDTLAPFVPTQKEQAFLNAQAAAAQQQQNQLQLAGETESKESSGTDGGTASSPTAGRARQFLLLPNSNPSSSSAKSPGSSSGSASARSATTTTSVRQSGRGGIILANRNHNNNNSDSRNYHDVDDVVSGLEAEEAAFLAESNRAATSASATSAASSTAASRRRASTGDNALDHSVSGSGSSSSPPHHGASSVAELKDLRARMVFYKRKCKEFKEVNAMMTSRVHAYSDRLREQEEWQRQVFQAGLLPPFMQPPLTPTQQQQQQQPPQSAQTFRAGTLLSPAQSSTTGTLLSPLPPLAATAGGSITFKLGGSGIKQPMPPPPAAQQQPRSANPTPLPMHQRFFSSPSALQQQPQLVFRPHVNVSNGGGESQHSPQSPVFHIRGGAQQHGPASPANNHGTSFLIQPAANGSASGAVAPLPFGYIGNGNGSFQPHPPPPSSSPGSTKLMPMGPAPAQQQQPGQQPLIVFPHAPPQPLAHTARQQHGAYTKQ
jgi:hypothetical protein